MKVFLGSTFTDLQRHRDQVLSALDRYAVHVDAMELWYAEPDAPLETCLRRVSASDVYCAVVAFRYGSMTPKGISFTEAEYDRAVEEGNDILVFLMDEAHPVPPQLVDTGETREKLDAFRTHLKEGHTCYFFGTPEDLTEAVVKSLNELLQADDDKGLTIVDLGEFWREVQAGWHDLEPVELKPEIDPGASLEELVSNVESELSAMEAFHSQIRDSFGRLTEDLAEILERIGCDPELIEEIPYYENPFEYRDWELVTLFPNRLIRIRVLLAQIRVRHLIEKAEWNSESVALLDEAKGDLRELLESELFID